LTQVRLWSNIVAPDSLCRMFLRSTDQKSNYLPISQKKVKIPEPTFCLPLRRRYHR
jgi:hypothetical protein